jgi:hypothetical protein
MLARLNPKESFGQTLPFKGVLRTEERALATASQKEDVNNAS